MIFACENTAGLRRLDRAVAVEYARAVPAPDSAHVQQHLFPDEPSVMGEASEGHPGVGNGSAPYATDKTDHELEAAASGGITGLHAMSIDKEIPVGSVIAIIIPEEEQ